MSNGPSARRDEGARPRAKTLLGRPGGTVRLLEPALGALARELRRAELLDAPASPPADGAPPFVVVDARELVEEVARRVREHSGGRDVPVEIRCTSRGARVQPVAFSAALFELLENAVRASHDGQSVLVDVRDTGHGDVLWQIQDAGAGISEQGLASLGQLPLAGSSGSAGLGVALAWAIIERHGGLLRFESAPGVGTTAIIWVPGRSTPDLRRRFEALPGP